MKILFLILAFFLYLPNSYAAQATKTLTWSDNSLDEDGFIIEAQRGGGEYVEIGRTGSNISSFKLNLRRNECYRVRAFNKWGISASSNIVCGKNYV